jgi:enamine deaminase RidA (YjgF/YER057c/UK114 family)
MLAVRRHDPTMSADQRFIKEALRLGFPVETEVVAGGNYVPALLQGEYLLVSGQVPRVTRIVSIGAVGEQVSLEQAQHAAQICTLRALSLARHHVGSLDKVQAVARVGVFVRSAPNFTQQAEVANGASDLLVRILGELGRHTRTSVGVLQLPGGASVEIEFVFKVGQ